MSDLLKNADLKDMSVEEFLEMSPEQVAEFTGFKPAPAGVYQGTTSVEAEMNEDEGFLELVIEIAEPTVVEFIAGAEGEAAEELTENDVPEKLRYSYRLPERGQNFKTDWDAVIQEKLGRPAESFREAMESVDGLAIQFTNDLFHTKVKDGPKKGEPRTYQNIKQITLLEV